MSSERAAIRNRWYKFADDARSKSLTGQLGGNNGTPVDEVVSAFTESELSRLQQENERLRDHISAEEQNIVRQVIANEELRRELKALREQTLGDHRAKKIAEGAVSASPAAPQDRASAAAGEAFVKFKNGEKPPTWLEVGEWLNKFELWPVVASPAAPQEENHEQESTTGIDPANARTARDAQAIARNVPPTTRTVSPQVNRVASPAATPICTISGQGEFRRGESADKECVAAPSAGAPQLDDEGTWAGMEECGAAQGKGEPPAMDMESYRKGQSDFLRALLTDPKMTLGDQFRKALREHGWVPKAQRDAPVQRTIDDIARYLDSEIGNGVPVDEMARDIFNLVRSGEGSKS